MHQIKSMAIQEMDASGKGLARLATLSAIDKGGDTYAPGAFSWKEGGEQWAMMVPGHNRRAIPFGKARVYEEGDHALAELHLNLETSAGRDWHKALMFDFAIGKPVQEWSYGYNSEYTYRVSAAGRTRVLTKVDVDEVSPVLRGEGDDTRTLAIKSAKLTDDHHAALIGSLGELASAIDADPNVVSASGLKQLREIHDAIGRVFGGAKEATDEEVKDAIERDTALSHALQFQQTKRRFGL